MNNQKVMSREQVQEVIIRTAQRYGFIATAKEGTFSPVDIREKGTHYLNFAVRANVVEFGRTSITLSMKFSASLASMGGNPAPEELIQAAEIIRNGGEMIKELEAIHIVFIESLQGV